MALPAFVRHTPLLVSAGHDISCPPGPQQQTCNSEYCGQCWDGRTDGNRTISICPAPHTMQAVPIRILSSVCRRDGDREQVRCGHAWRRTTTAPACRSTPVYSRSKYAAAAAARTDPRISATSVYRGTITLLRSAVRGRVRRYAAAAAAAGDRSRDPAGAGRLHGACRVLYVRHGLLLFHLLVLQLPLRLDRCHPGQ